MALVVKNPLAKAGDVRVAGLIPGLGISPGEGEATPVFWGLPCDLAGIESACNAGVLGSIAGLGRSPGEVKGYPLQYSGLENSMVHWVTRVGHD